jgi:hypothetical protein
VKDVSLNHQTGASDSELLTGIFVGILPKMRDRIAMNKLVAAGTAVFALATIALAYVHSFALLALALEASPGSLSCQP